MNDTFNIINNNEFTISKIDQRAEIIHYDNKRIFDVLFDTRDAFFNGNQLTITRLPKNYIKFVDVLRQYCYDVDDFPEIKCEKLQSELFDAKFINSLILIEFIIECNSLSLPMIKYNIINCNILINFNKSFWNINNVYKYCFGETKIISDNYWNYNHTSCNNLLYFLHEEVKLMKNDCENVYKSMLNWSCCNGHIDIVIYLHQCVKLTAMDFHECIFSPFKNGHINIVKYFHESIGLSIFDYKKSAFRSACINNHIDIIKYLHKEMNYNITKHRETCDVIQLSCIWSCQNGNVDMVRYLHKEIGFAKHNFQCQNNLPCRRACINNHIDIVKYLHKEIGFNKHDFQSDNNQACVYICDRGRLDIVKYFHKEIGFTKEDFKLYNIWLYKHYDVAKYLREEVGL